MDRARKYAPVWWAETWALSRQHFAAHAAVVAIIAAGIRAYVDGWSVAVDEFMGTVMTAGLAAVSYALLMLGVNGVRSVHRIYARQEERIGQLERAGPIVGLVADDLSARDGICRIYVAARVSDVFVARARYAVLPGNDVFPLEIRWKGSDDRRKEIPLDQHDVLDVVRVEFTRDTIKPPMDQVTIDRVMLLGPKAETPLPVMWRGSPQRLMQSVVLFCEISAISTGRTQLFACHLNVATNGNCDPQVDWVVRQGD